MPSCKTETGKHLTNFIVQFKGQAPPFLFLDLQQPLREFVQIDGRRRNLLFEMVAGSGIQIASLLLGQAPFGRIAPDLEQAQERAVIAMASTTGPFNKDLAAVLALMPAHVGGKAGIAGRCQLGGRRPSRAILIGKEDVERLSDSLTCGPPEYRFGARCPVINLTGSIRGKDREISRISHDGVEPFLAFAAPGIECRCQLLELLGSGLEFAVGGVQFLAGSLEFFIERLKLFVRCLLLFVEGFDFFSGGLDFLLAQLQLLILGAQTANLDRHRVVGHAQFADSGGRTGGALLRTVALGDQFALTLFRRTHRTGEGGDIGNFNLHQRRRVEMRRRTGPESRRWKDRDPRHAPDRRP